MSCNGGQKTRTRQCNDPMPLCDGAVCGGKNQEYETCNEDIPCNYLIKLACNKQILSSILQYNTCYWTKQFLDIFSNCTFNFYVSSCKILYIDFLQ